MSTPVSTTSVRMNTSSSSASDLSSTGSMFDGGTEEEVAGGMKAVVENGTAIGMSRVMDWVVAGITNHTLTTCHDVERSRLFIILAIAKLVVALTSISANAFVLYLLVRSRSFHSNVRLLLRNFTISAILLSIGLAAKAAYNCYVWHRGLFEMSAFACGASELGWAVGGSAMTMSISMIGLERVITTIWKRRFNDDDRPSTIAHSMVAACWASGFAGVVLTMIVAARRDTPLCYCFSVTMAPPLITLIVMPAYFVMELWTVLCYLYLYTRSRTSYLNFTINTTQHSLAERYQLLSNMETTSLLAPIMITHGLLYSGILATIMYIAVAAPDVRTTMDYAAVLLFVQGVEATLHPVLLLFKHKSMRKAAVTYFPVLKRLIDAEQVERSRVINMASVRFAQNTKEGGVEVKLRTKKMGGGVGVMASNGGTLVDFRVKPEDHENILNTLWEKNGRAK